MQLSKVLFTLLSKSHKVAFAFVFVFTFFLGGGLIYDHSCQFTFMILLEGLHSLSSNHSCF